MTPRPRNATFAILLSPKGFLSRLTAPSQPPHNTVVIYSIRCWPSTAAVDADLKKRYREMDDNKSKALAAALSQIEKQFGKGSIMKMDDAAIRDIDVVSTGSPGHDP